MDSGRNQNAAQLSKRSKYSTDNAYGDGADSKKKRDGSRDARSQAPADHQQRAEQELDWFKFETRIRTVIKDLMEPAHLRSQEIEKEYKKMRDLVTRLSKKLDAAEHQIEKIERKSSSQDELFQKVGVLDQNVKIHETRTSSELNNMNSNLELLKENMRRDTADVEENGKQIRKLHESINQLYEQILDAKKDLAAQVQKEARELQTKLLETKQYFEDQKDHVTQFDSTVQHLQKENLKRKAEIDGQFTQLSNQLDKYQLEIQRAERSYDGALDQFKVVFNQNLDLEAKVMTCTKKAAQSATEWKQTTKRFDRYVSIVAPMQSFAQTQRALDYCLRHQELNKFAQFAKDTMWPELQGNYTKYDKGGGQKGLLLDLDRPLDPPAPPELQEEPDFVTKDQVEEMIFKAVQAAGDKVPRVSAHWPAPASQRGPDIISQRRGTGSQQSKTTITDHMNSRNSRAREASQGSEEKAVSGPRQAETKTPTPALRPSSPARKAPSPERVASPHSPSEKMQATIQNEGGQAASEMSNYRSQKQSKAAAGSPEYSYAGKEEAGPRHAQREMPEAPRSQQSEKRTRSERPAQPGSRAGEQSHGQAPGRDTFTQDSAPSEEPYVDKSVKREQSEDQAKQDGDHEDVASKKEFSKQESEALGTPKPKEELEIGAKSPKEAEESMADEAKNANPKSEQVQKERSQASVSGAAPAKANEAEPASYSQPSSAYRTKEAKAPTPAPKSAATSKHNEDQQSRKESKARPNAKQIRQKDEERALSKQEEAKTQQNPLPEPKKQEPNPHSTTSQPKKEEKSKATPLAQLDESRIREIFVELRAKYKEEDRQQMKQIVEQAVRQTGKSTKGNDGEKGRAYGDLLDRIEDLNNKIEDVYDQIDDIRGINAAEDSKMQSKRAPSGRGAAPSQSASAEKLQTTDALIHQKFAEQDANLEKQMEQMRRLEGLLKKRAQRESDFTSERTKTQSVVNQFKFEIDNIYNKLAVVIQAICVLNAMHKLQSAITHQEEVDKKSVALYGLQASTAQQSASQANGKNPGSSQAKRAGTSASPPARANAGAGMPTGLQSSSYASALGGAANPKQQTVFTINKLCASCSGQNQHVIKLFKLACIYYQSSKVSYQGHELERDMVAELQSNLCSQIQMLMQQDGDYGISKIMSDKQLEIAQLVENSVLMHATKARSLLNNEDNKITSQPGKFFGETGIAHETWFKGGAGHDGKSHPAKHEKAFVNQQSNADNTLMTGLAATADPHQVRNTRASTDNLQVQLPQTTTASQMDELVKTAGASQGTGPGDSHRTRTPSPEPLNDQQFKMVHDIYSNKQATSLGQGHHSTKVARQVQQGIILTKAASALKYAPHFDEYEKENRNRGAGFPPGALDSESVHNQSNHSTIYAPNNLLSSSRKHQGHAKAIEALKRSTGSQLPLLRHSSAEWQTSPAAEPDIDVMIKVRNNAHEPISIAGVNLAGSGLEDSQLRSIYNTDQVNIGYPLRGLESQARSSGKVNGQASFMVKRTSNQNVKQSKQLMLFEQQHNRGKMTASAEQIREQHHNFAGQTSASLKSNPYNLHRHDQKMLTQFKSAALMRPVTQQYTVGDLATAEPHSGKQSQMVLGAKHGAASLGSRILSLDANAGVMNARLPATKQIGLQVEGEPAAIGQQITLGVPNSGSILIKNKLHEKRIPYQSGKRSGGLRQ